MITLEAIKKKIVVKPTDQILFLLVSETTGNKDGFLYSLNEKNEQTFLGVMSRGLDGNIKSSPKLREWVKKNLGSLRDRGV